jgi:undecaprenyl-diphosphatase
MLEVIILAIVQGIGEFLPISSSAHLIIFRDIFNIGDQIGSNMALSFDIALHLGTLLAIVVYFFKDFLNMFIKGITKGPKDNEGKIFWFIVIATIPAAIFGLLFEDIIDSVIRGNYIVIALALAVMGIIIYAVDRNFSTSKDFSKMSIKDALVIGFSQVFALIPGFSRSGTTIAAGRVMKLNREDSAKFSFYLSAPVVLGAVILTLFKDGTMEIISSNVSTFIIGVLVAFISGLLCIEFLLRYIKKHDFKIFMWYRLVLALIVIIWIFK